MRVSTICPLNVASAPYSAEGYYILGTSVSELGYLDEISYSGYWTLTRRVLLCMRSIVILEVFDREN